MLKSSKQACTCKMPQNKKTLQQSENDLCNAIMADWELRLDDMDQDIMLEKLCRPELYA